MKSLLTRLFTLLLVAVISLTGLTACSNPSNLSGNYRDDTLMVIESLRTAINVPTRLKKQKPKASLGNSSTISLRAIGAIRLLES